uniref:DNA-directed RNA polymerase subunit n=1 Tax=Hariotina sp. MMOGRB0030F TaxID=1867922 RepID=A0A2H4FMB0_9CHLO|nr:RNA polymerase beta' subunit [Hariotina sp. MMOGRB0030F]
MFGNNNQQIEQFFNSFYLLFESGIFLISQKTKKTKKKFISKKKLLFLINIVGFFHKIFVFKNTKFSKKKIQRIQSFLFAFFRRKKDFVLIETKEKSKILQKNKFEPSLTFYAKSHEKKSISNHVFMEKYFISFQFLKNFYDFSKNRKKIKFTFDQNSTILSPFEFFKNISNVEKILFNFQEYAKIEFSLIVQNQGFNEIQTFPNFQKSYTSGFQNTSQFPFFTIFQQILPNQKFSGIGDFSSQNMELNQSEIFDFRQILTTNLKDKNLFEDFISMNKNSLLPQRGWEDKAQVKTFGFATKNKYTLEYFLNQSQISQFFEKNIFEYFCLFLFFSTFQFLFPDFCFHDLQQKSRNLPITNGFEQNVSDHQIQNQFKNIENKSLDKNVPFLNFLKIFDVALQIKNPKIWYDRTFLSFQKLLNLSFLFLSSDLFSEMQKKVFHPFLFHSSQPNSDFRSYNHFGTNSYSLFDANIQKHSSKFHEINMKFSNHNFTIENLNIKVLFRKKLFKKMQQLQKNKFLPWQIQKEIVNSEVLNLKNKKIVQSSISIKVSKSLKKNQLNQNKAFKNSNFMYRKEKPWIWNFSLFSKQKHKFQSPEIAKTPFVSYGKKGNGLFHGSNFLKNFVYTIAYNFLWNNDSDWKYFVYYNSFFVHTFEDIPIVEYSFSPKRKNALFLSPGTSFSNFDDSFLSFLSFQIDSFQKNFLIGAGILEKLLTEYNSFELRKMTKQHQILLPKINQTIRYLKQTTKTKKDVLKIQKYFQKREHIIRRLKFLRKFFRRNSNPNFMILRNLPVLPPDLRPILKLQNQIAASDLNRFYQRIIYRNDRLKKFSKDSATNQSFEIQYAQRLLQEAVDNLIQNGKGGVKPETNSRGQALKSLSEILKGKQGRFRQYLLGKRVDYSGRSVIVVGPQLKLYECGLPREMAFELFLPFLIQYILHSKLAKTVIGAKNLLKTNSTLTFHLLHKVLQNIPVLLNRAPTLHRLGFQAFLPKLIDGRAILLHPMVCPAFNADFDGDQMAVHIPLTVEARTEAWKFMLATNNLMNSATGEPILLPSQDMVLGCYYLTLDYYSKSVVTQFFNLLKKQKIPRSQIIKNFSSLQVPSETFVQNGFFKNSPHKEIQKFQFFIRQHKSFLLYNNFHEILATYQKKEINLHTAVWVKWNAPVNFGNDYSKPVEIRLQTNGYWQLIQPKHTIFYNQKNHKFSQFIRTTTGRILMNLMIQKSIYFNT